MKLSEFLKICFFVNLITVDHATSMDYQVVPSINLNREFKLQIFGEKLFKINLSKEDCPDQPILIYIKTKILETEKSNSFSSVHFATFQGRSYEEWTLSSDNDTESALTPMCVECSGIDEDNSMYVFAKSHLNELVFVSIRISTEDDLLIEREDYFFRNITTLSPLSFLVQNESYFSDKHSIVQLIVNNHDENTKDVCMMISIQERICPLKNRPENAESAQMFSTALEKGTLSFRPGRIFSNDSFFVSIFVTTDDSKCHLGIISDKNSTNNYKPRKTISYKLSQMSSQFLTYFLPIFLPLCIILVIIFLAALLFFFKFYREDIKCCSTSMTNETQNGTRNNGERTPLDSIANEEENLSQGGRKKDLEELVKRVAADKKHKGKDILADRIDSSWKRLKPNAKFSEMSEISSKEIWFRRNRSRVYSYLIPIVCGFYFVPAIQYSFLAKKNEELFGNQDLCYHNFRCSKPFWKFPDFNHLISNISYFIFGLAFLGFVYAKGRWLKRRDANKGSNISVAATVTVAAESSTVTGEEHIALSPIDNRPNVEDNPEKNGVMQQLGIFYALGVALLCQSGFSICYHLCPTNLSLQFDTTIMYIICILGIIKIYQFRHPDASPTAYAVFGFSGFLVLIEAIVLYYSNWWTFGSFIALYMLMTVFIAFDGYYIGLGRTTMRLAFKLGLIHIRKPAACIDVFSRKRQFCAAIFVLINWSIAAYFVGDKLKNPKKTVSHAILVILGVNLFIYLLFFVFSKKCCNRQKNGSGRSQNRIHFSGILFSLLAIVFAVVGFLCYRNRNANRNLSAAESRNLNDNCIFLDFYDFHDLWHFFSAAAIFMAFLGLLTVDDDLLDVPRNEINVY